MLEEIDAVNSMGSSGRVRGQSERPNSGMSLDDLCQYNTSIENIPAVCLLEWGIVPLRASFCHPLTYSSTHSHTHSCKGALHTDV